MSRAFWDKPIVPLCPGCCFNVVCLTEWQQGMAPILRRGEIAKPQDCYRYAPLAIKHREETGFDAPATGDELLVQMGKVISREDREAAVAARQSLLEQVYPWWEDDLPVLDCESTGTDPYESRIVSLALLLVTPTGEVVESLSYRALVNCGVEIPADATAVHGITREQIQLSGLPPEEVFRAVAELLARFGRAGVPLIAYQAAFDWPLVWTEAQRVGITLPEVALVDPLCFDRYHQRYRKGGRKLVTLAAEYDISLANAHSAAADAVAAVGVARGFVARHPEVQGYSLAQLQEAQARWHERWKTSLNDWFKKKAIDRKVTGSWPWGDRPAPTITTERVVPGATAGISEQYDLVPTRGVA